MELRNSNDTKKVGKRKRGQDKQQREQIFKNQLIK